MATLKIGRTDDPANKVVKTMKPTASADTFQGTFRAPCSMTDPVFLIMANTNVNFFLANYLYWQEAKRYYYITNIIFRETFNRSTGNNPSQMVEIHAHVDVLMSFADSIKSQTAVVARQEKKYNMYLDDGIFMCYQNPKIQTKLFSNPTPFETQEFVLVVAGS